MATETNGIATVRDCNALVSNAFTTYSLNLTGNSYTTTHPTIILPVNTILNVNGANTYYKVVVPSTISVTITGTVKGDGTNLNMTGQKLPSITVGLCSSESSTTFEKSANITFLTGTTATGSVSIDVPPGVWYLKIICTAAGSMNATTYSSIVSTWSAATEINSIDGWCPPYSAIIETGKFKVSNTALKDNQCVMYSYLSPAFQAQTVNVDVYKMIACEPQINSFSLPAIVLYNNSTVSGVAITGTTVGTNAHTVISTSPATSAETTTIKLQPAMYGTGNANITTKLYYQGKRVGNSGICSQNGPSSTNYVVPTITATAPYSGSTSEKIHVVLTDNSQDEFNFNRGVISAKLPTTATLTANNSYSYFNWSSSALATSITSISYFKNTLAKSGRVCWPVALNATVSSVTLVKYDSAWNAGYIHVLVNGKLFIVNLTAAQAINLNNGRDIEVTASYVKTIS